MKEQLPAQVLAELFTNSLVYTGERIQAVTVYEESEPASAEQKPVINKKPVTKIQEPALIKAETAETKRNAIAPKSEIQETMPAPVEEKVVKPGKWYLGNYEKNFIVLVNDESNVYLDDKDLEFLTGILNACKMNLAHIALINFKNHSVRFQQLKKDLQPKYIVAFGVNALEIELPFSMPDYQVQQYDNCAIVTAPPLQLLNKATPAAKTEKTKLWNSLKKMLDL